MNLVSSPDKAYRTGDLIRSCFSLLGPRIRSCHAKDVVLREGLTVHLDECAPGTGLLDYGTYLAELARLDRDTPLIMEHLPREAYPAAAAHIRSVAASRGVALA